MAIIHHSIVVGQSLATGDYGTPAISPDIQASNYIKTISGDGSLAPLGNSRAGTQIPERTIAEASWPGGTHLLSINTHAEGGRNYTQLKKGTAKYAEAIASITAGKNYASSHQNILQVEAMHVIHGESDQGEGTTKAQYIANLAEWRSDFEADIATITGQQGSYLHEIFCQVGGNTAWSIAHAQLAAHRQNSNAWLVGPKYQFTYVDGVHLDNVSYFKLGEYHAKVHRRVVTEKGRWDPLQPESITISGRDITVVFRVPVEPLVFDTTLISAQQDMGFTFTDDAGNHGFSTVNIVSPNTVVLTLSQDPVGTMRRLSYGRPGNLRDSDTAPSAYDGQPLYNWCCLFQEDIPFSMGTKPLVTPANDGGVGPLLSRRLRMRT